MGQLDHLGYDGRIRFGVSPSFSKRVDPQHGHGAYHRTIVFLAVDGLVHQLDAKIQTRLIDGDPPFPLFLVFPPVSLVFFFSLFFFYFFLLLLFFLLAAIFASTPYIISYLYLRLFPKPVLRTLLSTVKPISGANLLVLLLRTGEKHYYLLLRPVTTGDTLLVLIRL